LLFVLIACGVTFGAVLVNWSGFTSVSKEASTQEKSTWKPTVQKASAEDILGEKATQEKPSQTDRVPPEKTAPRTKAAIRSENPPPRSTATPATPRMRVPPPLNIPKTEMSQSDAKEAVMAFAGKPLPLIRVFSVENNDATIELGGTRLHLKAPKGQCFLDFKQFSDSQILMKIQQRQGDVRMIASFADCSQLQNWRTDQKKGLAILGNFRTPSLLLKKVANSSEPKIDMACQIMRKASGEFKKLDEENLKEKLENAILKKKKRNALLLGVLAQDKNACYVGRFQPIGMQDGRPKIQISILAISIIGGKMFYVESYSLLENDNTIKEHLERQKAVIHRNVAANTR
jgi:hypothetical protein